jgi:urease accessory protein
MRAIAVKSAFTWSGATIDRVVLDYDSRHRRRVAMKGAKGVAFLLDLPAATGLRGGDALVLEDGSLIEVVAAPEPLLEIGCTDPKHLARLAWHLGNRHLATQVLARALRVRRDHVIADMVVRLGADVVEIEAPFEPEAGAYQKTHHNGHGHA